MTTTPKTASPELAESQADKEEDHNEGLRRIEAGASLYLVVDRDLTAPPGSCADGAQYIVASGGSGAWAAHDDEVAIAVGTNAANGWYFRAPEAGVFAFVQDEAALCNFDGAVWATFAAGAVAGVTVEASEALAARDGVNVWSDSGTAKLRKADPDDADKECDGFVTAAVSMGDPATLVTNGKIGGFAGLTEGVAYYLAAAAGTISDTAAGSAFRQRIGKAVSATEIVIRLDPALPVP